MTNHSAATFNPKVVLALVLFGALAFLAALYFIGSGQTGNDNDGGGHAAGKGLNGYAALAQMLQQDGYEVNLSRSPAALDDKSLLILTPPVSFDAKHLQEVVSKRRYIGPTLIVLPKWYVTKIPSDWKVEKRKGWVVLGGAGFPFWAKDLRGNFKLDLSLDKLTGPPPDWTGLGLSGALPARTKVMSLSAGSIVTLVHDSRGQTLAGYLDDGGYYPVLADAAGVPAGNAKKLDTDLWGVTIVAEPDLLNNYGMADKNRARLARRLIQTACEDEDLPITFDLTQNGIGQTKNLLTLAVTPPFLAATLCLILAMFLAGWRAFRRFGPAAAEDRAIAFGKQQLIANSAQLIQRTRRLHLLAGPYADMMHHRIAALLGLPHGSDQQLDALVQRRLTVEAGLSQQISQLRTARSRKELLRAAAALRILERKLAR